MRAYFFSDIIPSVSASAGRRESTKPFKLVDGAH